MRAIGAKKLGNENDKFQIFWKKSFTRIIVAPSFFWAMKNLKYTPESSCSYLQNRFKQNFCKSIPLGVRANGAKKKSSRKSKMDEARNSYFAGNFSMFKSEPHWPFFQDSDQLNQAQDVQAYFGTSFEEFDGLVVSESIFEIGGKIFSISFIIVYFFRAIRGCVITQSRVSP